MRLKSYKVGPRLSKPSYNIVLLAVLDLRTVQLINQSKAAKYPRRLGYGQSPVFFWTTEFLPREALIPAVRALYNSFFVAAGLLDTYRSNVPLVIKRASSNSLTLEIVVVWHSLLHNDQKFICHFRSKVSLPFGVFRRHIKAP